MEPELFEATLAFFLFPPFKKNPKFQAFYIISLFRVFLEFKVIFSWVYLKSNLGDLTTAVEKTYGLDLILEKAHPTLSKSD